MDLVTHIKRVEIKGLWSKDFVWNLHHDVNILAGANGSGKSTILECIYSSIENPILIKHESIKRLANDVQVEYGGLSGELLHIDVIRGFDDLQRFSEVFQKFSNEKFISSKNSLEEIWLLKDRFCEIIDTLFQETGKTIIRNSNEVSFLLDGHPLSPYNLSFGEKQILIILLTVLFQTQKPSVLLMDHPEIFLHVDWQKKLIGYIRELNPNVQVILTTHSPALILEGWHDKVFEVSDLVMTK